MRKKCHCPNQAKDGDPHWVSGITSDALAIHLFIPAVILPYLLVSYGDYGEQLKPILCMKIGGKPGKSR